VGRCRKIALIARVGARRDWHGYSSRPAARRPRAGTVATRMFGLCPRAVFLLLQSSPPRWRYASPHVALAVWRCRPLCFRDSIPRPRGTAFINRGHRAVILTCEKKLIRWIWWTGNGLGPGKRVAVIAVIVGRVGDLLGVSGGFLLSAAVIRYLGDGESSLYSLRVKYWPLLLTIFGVLFGWVWLKHRRVGI